MKRVTVLATLCLAAGCISSEDAELAAAAPSHQYVVSQLTMPDSVADSAALGFDLDGDGGPDNHLGTILAQLFQADVANVNLIIDELVTLGQIVHLIEVEARSLEQSARAGASMYVGSDMDSQPGDNFSGREQFAIEIADTAPLQGHIHQGLLSVGPGTVVLKLALPGGDSPFVVDVIGAHMEGNIVAGGLQGRVGGAISKASIDDTVIPFIHSAISSKLATDCPNGICSESSAGQFFLDLFDRNDDGQVTLGELRGNPVVEALSKPDVDLLDSNGEYAPGSDGVLDSLSIAVRIGCVGAEF